MNKANAYMTTLINIVAGCLLDEQQRLLVVRKRDTQRFMLPGGKPEAGETPLATLTREWREELGIRPAGDIKRLGTFSAKAANEAQSRVQAIVFCVEQAAGGDIECAAEIAEYSWLALQPPYALALAPLLETQVLPALSATLDH